MGCEARKWRDNSYLTRGGCRMVDNGVSRGARRGSPMSTTNPIVLDPGDRGIDIAIDLDRLGFEESNVGVPTTDASPGARKRPEYGQHGDACQRGEDDPQHGRCLTRSGGSLE